MKIKWSLSVFMLIPILTLIAFLCYGFYIWYTYINDTVTSGNAYGFTIGDSKPETYKKSYLALSKLSDNVYIEIRVTPEASRLLATNSDHTILASSLLHDVGYPGFEKKNGWGFYFEASYFNSLTLRFCNERLCEIHRHRKSFELP